MPTITGATGVNDVITVTGPGEWYVDGDNTPNADPGLPDDLLIVNLQNDTDGIVDRNPIFSTRSWGSRTLDQNDPNYVFIRHDRFERFELNLGSGADSVFTGDGDDVVRSGAGDDFVNTGRGRATVDLGSGVDRWQADLSALGESGVLDLSNAAAQAFMGGTVAGVESLNLTLGDGAHTIVSLSGARGVGLSDTINAGGGNDVVKIGGGNDRVSGGAGDDLLIVDLSNDTNGIVNRNPISDSRSWGSSTLGSGDTGYVFIRHDGFERFDLTLGSGNDEVFTGDGDDVVRSGAGNDVVDTGAGRATVDLGAGVDFWTADLSALTGGSVLDLAASATQAFMGGSVTGVERVNLTLGAGSQTVLTLTGAAGAGLNDTLVMGDGDDVVRVGGGSDRVSGGAGDDLLIIDLATDTDGIVNRNPISSTVSFGSRSLGSSDAGYVFVRHDGFERIDAQLGSGVDSFTAYGGDDVVRAGAGADTIGGGAGNDLVFGQAGDDVLSGGDGNDTLVGGAGADRLDGGAGFDFASYADAAAAVTVNLSGGVTTTDGAGDVFVSIEGFRLSGFGDSFTGGAAGDYVLLGGGNDFAAGLGGADWIEGEAGNDALFGNAGTDTLFGGSGDDYLDGQEDADVLFGGQGADQAFGGAGDDVIYGGSANLDSAFNDGGDFILGGAGNDVLYGEAGVDLLGGEDGNDTLYGGFGGDNMYGAGGNDLLIGDFDNDFMSGGDGDDVLIGGQGADQLNGGAGSDRYVFYTGDSVLGAGDRIQDFAVGFDKIDLSQIDANTTVAGKQDFAWAGLTNAPTGAGTVRLGFIEGVGIFLFGYTDGDGVADFIVDVGTFAVSRNDLILGANGAPEGGPLVLPADSEAALGAGLDAPEPLEPGAFNRPDPGHQWSPAGAWDLALIA